MWTSKSIRVLAFGFFGVALLTCVPARAQQVEEVVVTAQKKSETLQSVPIAITAVSAQEIANLNIKDIQGVQLETPGMVFNTDAAFAQAYIRGIGVNFALAGLESPVANYEDDVYAPRTFGGMYDLMDVSDVEVLKGPQGALYGRNATGGAIVINTANPSDKEEGNIYTEFGDYGKEVVSAMVNEPVSDTLKIRVAGRWENQDGYVKNLYNGPLVDGLGESQNGHINLDGYLDDQLRAKVDWKPIDRLDILASTEYTYRRGETTDRTQVDEAPECLLCFLDAIAPLIPQYAIGARPPQGGFYSTLQDVVNSSRVQSIFSTVKTVYNFEDFQLSSITGYRNMVFNGSSDEGGQLGGFLIDHNDDKSHTFSEELRLASEFGGPFNFLSGLEYQRDVDDFEGRLYGGAFPLSPTAATAARNQTNVRTDSASGYLEAYYNFTDALKATVGGRYSFDRRELDSYNNFPATVQLANGLAGFREQANYYDFVPKYVLSYQYENGNYYISDSKGFKAGGFNATAYGGPSVGQGPVAPEKLHSEEVGAKNSWFDDRLRTTFAAYHYAYDGIQVSITNVATGGQIVKNAGEAEDVGAELSADFAATDNLTLSAGGAYTHARYTKFHNAVLFYNNVPGAPCYAPGVPGNCTYAFADLSGTPLPNAPDWTAYGSINYKVDLPYDWIGDANALAHWSSRYLFTAGGSTGTETDAQKPTTLVDVTLTAAPPGSQWEFKFYAKNILSTKYYNVKVSGATGTYYDPAPPFMFSFSAEYKFGNWSGSPPAAEPAAAPPPAPTVAPPTPVVKAPEAQRSFQVFFDFDKSDITSAAAQVIEAAAEAVKAGNAVQIAVTGHTDTVGTAKYNLALSERRAAAVKQQLVTDGVASGEITATGVGKTGLLVPTADGVREPQNRRAEIVLM